MHLRMSIGLSLAVAVSVTACQLPLSIKRAAADIAQEGTIRRAPIAGVAIRGTLMAPAGLIANNSAGLISNNGSGLIGKTKTYRLAGLSESPLADAEVFLATADGRPVPGIASVRTDAQGNFVFPRVPKGFAFVAASGVKLDDGTEGQLATLVKAADGAADARISLASTLVTSAIVRGQAGTVGDFSPKAFDQALQATAEHLEPADVAKVADPAAAASKVEEVAKADEAVQNALSTLKQEVAAPTKSLDELQTVVATINAAPSSAPASTKPTTAPASTKPSATATASTQPSASPSTGASAAPSSAPSGLSVATLAGRAATEGFADGKGGFARFSSPVGIAVASDGTVFVADTENHRIRKITAEGIVSVFAGSATVGHADGRGAAATFDQPWGMAIDDHDTLYVTDIGSHTIRTIAPDGTVATLAGSGAPGKANGVGTAARFNSPKGLCVADGKVYVADTSNQLIRVIAPGGAVTTLAGSSYSFADGKGASAAFRNPTSVALGPDGTLYVADGNNYAIRAVTPDGTVGTLAGKPAEKGRVDGVGGAARFEFLACLVWAEGRLVVCDQVNHAIRTVTPDGTVGTLAGAGVGGSTDGPIATARFRQPRGVAARNGKIYVSDSMNHTIRTIR